MAWQYPHREASLGLLGAWRRPWGLRDLVRSVFPAAGLGGKVARLKHLTLWWLWWLDGFVSAYCLLGTLAHVSYVLEHGLAPSFNVM